MRKAMDEIMGEELRKANLFIEVRDARIPLASHNHDLIELIKERAPSLKRLVVFNKMDLANESKSLAIIKRMREQADSKRETSIAISTKKNQNVSKVLTFI
jgi:ribosome biogenesis GTPase A